MSLEKAKCFYCKTEVDNNDLIKCGECYEVYCKDCFNKDANICESCRKNFVECDQCGTLIYYGDEDECSSCGDTICEDCSDKCSECNKTICSDEINECSKCGEDFCNDCLIEHEDCEDDKKA